MTPARARYLIRQPRHTRPGRGGAKRGWFYIEEDGLSVLAPCGPGHDATFVRLTWKQIEQALALRRAAMNGEAPRANE